MIGPFLARQIAAQRGHLFLWVPIAMSFGIGVYFQIRFEPSFEMLIGLSGTGLLLAVLSRWAGETVTPLLMAVSLMLLAFSWSAARAHLVAEPVLKGRFYGPIEGRIVTIDRSVSDKLRLTLDQAVLGRVPQARTPHKVRVSLHGRQAEVTFQPGQRVVMTGHLSAPSGPVEPGGFDFRRQAWFQKIGAVGYTRTPVLVLEDPPTKSWATRLDRARLALSRRIQDRIPGQAGAMAAAITTGDRSGLSTATLEDMRHSNLAHLLAISGLHVGLLTAVVFGAVRGGLALIPPVALRVSTKKWAACTALLAAGAYLLVSGGTVSTQRAFIMVAVMLLAVLADRRAITLRAVSLAAVIVLLIRPEALLGPGFQMSFAATTALVWVFSLLRDMDLPRLPKWARGVTTLVLSSFVAGLATAPFAAAHFNQISSYGLVANLAAVPVMGSIVAPAAVLAGLLALLGLEGPALWVMGQGLHWILAVAAQVSEWPNALRFIVSPEALVMPVMAFGTLWVILWRGWGKAIGGVLCAFALGVWMQTQRPQILISDTGGLLGHLTEAGRALNKQRGDGFAARTWLENDGGQRDREEAFNLATPQLDGKVMQVSLPKVDLVWMPARQASCRSGEIVVTPGLRNGSGCEWLDRDALHRTGALALTRTGESWAVSSVIQVTGARLWSRSTRDQNEEAHQILTRLEAKLNGEKPRQ